MIRRKRIVIAQGVVYNIERVGRDLSFVDIIPLVEPESKRVLVYMDVPNNFKERNVDIIEERKGFAGGILAQEISAEGLAMAREVSFAWVIGINKHYGWK